MFPSDITNRWSAWRNMAINDNGSKVFFRAVVEAGYYDDEYIYVHNVASSGTRLAVSMDEGFSPLGSAWRFRINENGDRVYMDKYDAGWSEELQKRRKGLFYADTESTRQWYFDVEDLSCASKCGNLNMFALLGVSFQNDRAFFKWNSDYSQTDKSNQHTGLYYTDLSGNPMPLSEEHYLIYEGDWRGISDTEGNTVIYRFKHEYGVTLQELAVVDVASKQAREVAWTRGLNGFDAHLSRSGRYVLHNGEYGDDGTYYQTLLDLQSETSRDTWSYHMMSRWGGTSNLTEDDRYYFYTIDNNDKDSGLYRIDTQSTGDDHAPNVESIQFSAPALLDDDETAIAVQVKISDPQGLEDIDRVTLLPLIEGQEDPEWPMSRGPLAFPSGDPGSIHLYDDGTHGDSQAGDGIFSFDSIATRKNGREEDGWNTWYRHFSLPADVGIRIVAKDSSNHYAIADTTLRITDDPGDLPGPTPVESPCAQIADTLNISIPCVEYSNPFFGTINLRINFEYQGQNSQRDYIWKLTQYEEVENIEEKQCGTISETLGVFIPCANFTGPSGKFTWWLTFGHMGSNDQGELFWRLEGMDELQYEK